MSSEDANKKHIMKPLMFQIARLSHSQLIPTHVRTCFVLQYDDAGLIDAEHVVNNVPRVHESWI